MSVPKRMSATLLARRTFVPENLKKRSPVGIRDRSLYSTQLCLGTMLFQYGRIDIFYGIQQCLDIHWVDKARNVTKVFTVFALYRIIVDSEFRKEG